MRTIYTFLCAHTSQCTEAKFLSTVASTLQVFVPDPLRIYALAGCLVKIYTTRIYRKTSGNYLQQNKQIMVTLPSPMLCTMYLVQQ